MRIENINSFAYKKKLKTNNNYIINPSKQFFNSDVFSFTSLKIPVYVVDSKNKRTRFNSYKEASQGNSGIYGKISSALNKEPSVILQGNTYIKAQEVEYADSKIDENKFQAMLSYPYTKNMDLVLISLDGEHKEFTSLRECAKYLDIKDEMAYKLLNPTKTIYGYILLEKEKVSTTMDDAVVIDPEKIKKAYEEKFRTKLETIYGLTKDGKIEKYASLRECAKKLNERYRVVIKNTGEEKRIIRDSILLTEDEITTKQEDGNRVIDYKKVEAAYLKYFKAQYGIIYTIGIDGQCKSYRSAIQCAKALDVNKCEINKALNKEKGTVANHIIAKLEEITEKQNGAITLDESKIKALYQSRFGVELEPLYGIKETGEFEKFASIKHATTKTEISRYIIDKILKKEENYYNNYTFVYAHEVEKTNKYGKTVIDRDKIDTIADKSFPLIRRPVFVIEKTGEPKKYESLSAFAKEKGIEERNAARIINKKSITKEGYMLVLESDIISHSEQGQKYFNKNKIATLQKMFQKPKEAVYAISKDGKYLKLDSIEACAKYFNISKGRAYAILAENSKKRTADGHTFVWAREIENNENLDKKEIEKNIIKTIREKFQKTDSKKQVPNKRSTKICAISESGECRFFDSAKECMDGLGIKNYSQVYQILNKNKGTANGYAIVKAELVRSFNEDNIEIINYDKINEIIAQNFPVKNVKKIKSTEKTTSGEEEKEIEKFYIFNLETKKVSLGILNQKLLDFLKTDECDFRVNISNKKIFRQKYIIIPYADGSTDGKTDKDKLKKEISKYNKTKEEAKPNPTTESKTKQVETEDVFRKTRYQGEFQYSQEDKEITEIEIPDISSSVDKIKYCVLDIQANKFGFYKHKNSITEILKLSNYEIDETIKRKRILNNRYCIIPFDKIASKENNVYKININKFKEEILDFIKTQEVIQKLFETIFNT